MVLLVCGPISFMTSCMSLCQLDEDKGKGSSSGCTKSVAEQLEEEVYLSDFI